MNHIPQNKVGYTFSFTKENVLPINKLSFTVTKFANEEKEAIAETIEDAMDFLTYLLERQQKVGKLIISPFAATTNQ